MQKLSAMKLLACYCLTGKNDSFQNNLSCLMTKPTKWPVRPAKTLISLGMHPVWSESSLYAQWVAKDPSFLHVDSEDSDQTGQMPRPICLCWAHCHFVGFVMLRLILMLFQTDRLFPSRQPYHLADNVSDIRFPCNQSPWWPGRLPLVQHDTILLCSSKTSAQWLCATACRYAYHKESYW